MKNWIIAALVAALAVSATVSAIAATRTIETTTAVDVTVWQRVSDGSLYLSTRPEGESWTTHEAPLDLNRRSRSGRFRVGSAIRVTVPVEVPVDVPPAPPAPRPGQPPEITYETTARGAAQVTVLDMGPASARIWLPKGQLWVLFDIAGIARDDAQDISVLLLGPRSGYIVNVTREGDALWLEDFVAEAGEYLLIVDVPAPVSWRFTALPRPAPTPPGHAGIP